MERKAFVLLVLLGFFLSERALAAVPADVLSPEGTLEERERRIVEQVRQLARQGTGSSGTLVGGKLVVSLTVLSPSDSNAALSSIHVKTFTGSSANDGSTDEIGRAHV